MDLGELILRYYLSLFSFFLIIYLIYLIFFSTLNLEKNLIKIDKGDSISKIINSLSYKDNLFLKKTHYLTLIITNKLISPVNYGKFKFPEKANFLNILKIITKKSNQDYKITIIEGWQEFQLNNYLNKFYNESIALSYENILAETYIINSSNSFSQLELFLKSYTHEYLYKFYDNDLIKKYGFKKILIISSLVEKEAKNENDKRLIASVIFNRLDKKMKLQIDASVIFSITKGKRRMKRSLNYEDLKIKDPYNTYYIKSLPPGMISYVSPKTIKIVLENTKSDFLFYYYDVLEKKHIFSRSYNMHKTKLYEYRKKNK